MDSQIPSSQLPAITGTSIEIENDYDTGLLDVSHSSSVHSPSSHRMDGSSSPMRNTTSSAKKFIPPTTFYSNTAPRKHPKPKGPLFVTFVIVNALHNSQPHRHDPDAEDAVVMKAPTEEHISRFNRKLVRYTWPPNFQLMF